MPIEELKDYLQTGLFKARFAIDLSDRFLKDAVKDNNYSMAVYWDAERQKEKVRMDVILDVAKLCKIDLADLD